MQQAIAHYTCEKCGHDWKTGFSQQRPHEDMVDACLSCMEDYEVNVCKPTFVSIPGGKNDRD